MLLTPRTRSVAVTRPRTRSVAVDPLHEPRIELDVDIPLQRFRDGTTLFCFLRDLIELHLVDLGNRRLDVQLHGSDAESAGHSLYRARSTGLDLGWWSPVLLETGAQGHAEAGGFSCRQ